MVAGLTILAPLRVEVYDLRIYEDAEFECGEHHCDGKLKSFAAFTTNVFKQNNEKSAEARYKYKDAANPCLGIGQMIQNGSV